MITKFARLEFELFTKPSNSDFLRDHQIMVPYIYNDDNHKAVFIKIATDKSIIGWFTI